MKITLLCSDVSHPVNPYLLRWADGMKGRHVVELVRDKADARGGDVLFLISCSEVVESRDRDRYAVALVLHASDLPQGRGWSPHIWELSRGAEFVTLSLIEAGDKVDAGDVWKKVRISVPPHALWDEINALLFEAELKMMDFAIEHFGQVVPSPQPTDIEVTYYPKRSPANSEINPDKSIAEQFDLIRVCDPIRFPAFFYHRGHRYVLKLEKDRG